MASWSGMEIEEKTFDEFETEMVSFVQIPELTQNKPKGIIFKIGDWGYF